MATPSQTLTRRPYRPGRMNLDLDFFPPIFDPQDSRLCFVPYQDASESLGKGFEAIVSELDPTVDHKEDGVGKDGYWDWFKTWEAARQERQLGEPFGHYLVTYQPEELDEPFVVAACGIVFDDRNVRRDHNVAGDGFWAGTIIRHGFSEAGLWDIMWGFRYTLCQKFADRQGRAARFNLITSSPELASKLIKEYGFTHSGKITVTTLGEVDLLYKVFQPTE